MNVRDSPRAILERMLMTNASTNITDRIADYVCRVTFEDLPAPVRHQATRTFLNFLGCAIGGSNHEAVELIERTLGAFSGPAQATIIGRRERHDVLLASLINCMSSSVHAFDDTHATAMVHPGGPVAAAILALAEHNPVSGTDFLVALTLGIEIQCRLSKAISVAPARANLAWVQTGVAGGIGASVAAAKLLGFDARQTGSAIGIAAAHAAGIRGIHGSMSTALIPAHACQTGLRAALLAQRGLTSGDDPVGGRYGYTSAFAKMAHLPYLVEGLGTTFETLSNTYKPFPCGIVVNPVIDACLRLKRNHDVEVGSIGQIEIRASPAAFALANRPHPKDNLEAQLSVQHWAAAALARGAAGIDEGGMEQVHDPVIHSIRDRIDLASDPAIGLDAAIVTVRLDDGQSLDSSVDHCIGSASNPMTDRDLEEKCLAQAKRVMAPDRVAKLIDMCWRLATLTDVGAIGRASGASPTA